MPIPEVGVAMSVYTIPDDWETPYTRVSDQVWGRARLRSTHYSSGVYPMEGILGYEYFNIPKGQRVHVAQLQVNEDGKWKTWMVDDPLHWLGMNEYVGKLKSGSVLCAGLGLGLMLFHLYERQDITSIVVVERGRDVIDMISKLVPKDARVSIVNDDYEHFAIEHRGWDVFDNVLWDLAVGEKDNTRRQFIVGKAFTSLLAPQANKIYFGLKDKAVA